MSIAETDDIEKVAGLHAISPTETETKVPSPEDGTSDAVKGMFASSEDCIDNFQFWDASVDTTSTARSSCLQSFINTLTLRRHRRQDPQSQLKVRSLDEFQFGYPNLAAFKNSSECFTVYRRFGYLQSRLLLEKQDILRVLEHKLDEYDRDHISTSYTRSLSDEEILPRQNLLEEIEKVFNSYATILQSSQQMLAINRPTSSEYRSVRRYLDNNNPLHDSEMEYIQHKEDLITLRPGRDHAWLDRRINRSLHLLHKPFPWLNRIFCSPEDSLKSRPTGAELYYTRERIDLCASSLVTLTIAALLIIPIYLLYSIVARSSSSLKSDDTTTAAGNSTTTSLNNTTTAQCIAILLVSTLLFSGVLSLFTRAKRHEILGAAAAYCAVLVVFLGNVPG